MRNTGLEEAQAGIKMARRNINNLSYTDDTTLMTENKEELKSLLLKTQHSKNKDHGIQSRHFMANTWGKNGNSGRLFSWDPKITVDADCSYEIKRHLLLGKKAMTNLDSVLKSRDITLPTEVHVVKAMVFLVVTNRYGELDHKEGCGAKEDSCESPGQQGD